MAGEKLKDYEQAKYTQTYRRKHPEKVQKWQENAYANYLRKRGWACTLSPAPRLTPRRGFRPADRFARPRAQEAFRPPSSPRLPMMSGVFLLYEVMASLSVSLYPESRKGGSE